MEIEQRHRDFINLNIINFQTLEHGYVRNLGPLLDGYEQIYRAYLDPGFVLTKWCGDCVMRMMSRLKAWWEKNNTPVIEVENIEEVLEKSNVPLHKEKANRRRK